MSRRPRNGEVDVPHQAAGEAVQTNQVRIVGREEDSIAQESHAAVRAFGGVARNRAACSARARIAPDLASGARVERADPVRSRDVHHAVAHQRSSLQSDVGKRVNPIELQTAHVLGVDLSQRAMSIRAEEAVISGPFAGLGIQNLLDRLGWNRRLFRCQRTGSYSVETAEIRQQIAALLAGGLQGRHETVLARARSPDIRYRAEGADVRPASATAGRVFPGSATSPAPRTHPEGARSPATIPARGTRPTMDRNLPTGPPPTPQAHREPAPAVPTSARVRCRRGSGPFASPSPLTI